MLHIKPTNKDFPGQLASFPQPPAELFIESKNWPALIDQPMLAVVGSRRLSPYGRAVTEKLVRAVAAQGVVIVSGLALGIDSVAHQAALDAGGKTIAVLPSGLNHIYPSSHTTLAKNIIAQGGALLTEYTPNTSAAFKGNFIARNRLIAGLAAATLVTEAAEKSGSLHTAMFALEQGKEVLAVPGPINNTYHAGCNNLIKTGAKLVSSPDDIYETLAIRVYSPEHTIIASNDAEHTLLQLLKSGISDGDELFEKSKLSFVEYQQTVTMLEITGKIKSVGGNTWTLI
jgi:DNA processing protein